MFSLQEMMQYMSLHARANFFKFLLLGLLHMRGLERLGLERLDKR